ncbi:MAG: hypothetical protein H0W72_00685 [Planctomycetes bacterium]|nr:hypothetical protein [Planctomycetota bacterium]
MRHISSLSPLLACLPMALCLGSETENHGLRVLPAATPLVIDGSAAGWDLSGGIFACGEVEHLRDRCSLWVHAMHDADNLYVLARWKDPTPINNPEHLGGYGFNGDCLQLRFIIEPDKPGQTVTWWTAWQDASGRSVVDRGWPGPNNHITDNPLPNLSDTSSVGVRQAFRVDADGAGYVQELSIPWRAMSVGGKPPGNGEPFRMTIEPNFTAGQYGRITIKDLFDPRSQSPDRIFTFNAYKHWGFATNESAGAVAPQRVRLADGRTFAVSMVDGAPTVDWSGLMHAFAWPGFEPISFDMPFDGIVSLNLRDAQGVVVRHLLNADPRKAGKHTVQWDGLTDAVFRTPGVPVSAGTYTWEAIAHPGATLSLRGWASGGPVPWQATPRDFWLGDHGVPSSVVTDGTSLYLACNGAEGGRHLLRTDLDGRVTWGLQNTTGAPDPESIAIDQAAVYVLQAPAQIARVDAVSGAYAPWPKGTSHLVVGAQIFGEADKSLTAIAIDARDGAIYLTAVDATASPAKAVLMILDPATGAAIKRIPIPSAGAVRAVDAKTVLIACGERLLSVNLANSEQKTICQGKGAIAGIAVDVKKQEIYLSLGAPHMQVLVVTSSGKELRRVGRQGGRPAVGGFLADGMYCPAGLAVSPDGKLWVMERDAHPKRVSVWEPMKGGLVRQFFGPTHYGASGGAIDPRDPNLMVGEGCEWRIDQATGREECLATFDHNHHNFATFREAGGRQYLYTYAGGYSNGTIQVFERVGLDAGAKHGSFALRATLRPVDKGLEVWTDSNGDEVEQRDEIQSHASYLHAVGSNGWSMNLGPDLALYGLDYGDRALKRLSVVGFSPCGAPRYDVAKLETMPAEWAQGYEANYSSAMPSADNRTILINLKQGDFTWCGFDLKSGKRMWTYPNPYFQVHGSHNAPAPERGLFRGAFGAIGSATLPGVGSFWVINGNLGEWYALSASGYFVSGLFNGNVFEWQWPEAKPGADLRNVPAGSGGEDFGGSITQGADGAVYLQAGKMALLNVALGGIDKTVVIPGAAVEISAADTATAQTFREQALQRRAGNATLTAKPATIAFTGKFAEDFSAAERITFEKDAQATVRCAIAHDANTLYVGWSVEDPTPWVNGASDTSQMYACGDTVDLQLGSDPAADAKRDSAVPGDLRLSIGNLGGKPTAVLYRFVSEQKKPRMFSSGVVRDWQVDWVDVLASVVVDVAIDAGKGYTVEAAIPLKDLGIAATPGLRLRGDLGATHGDPAGSRTRLRTYWSNQSTGLVDDVVFELKPTPQHWGTIVLE